MGEKALVDSLLSDSVDLVRRLDASAYAPTLAVWYFYEDADEWRLLIAGPGFDKLLPDKEAIAYQKLFETISSAGLQSLSISLVKLTTLNDPLRQAVRSLVGTPPSVVMRAHFSDTTLNGIFIKEMVVLRAA